MDRMSNIFSLDELKNNIQELSKNIITSYLYEEGGGEVWNQILVKKVNFEKLYIT